MRKLFLLLLLNGIVPNAFGQEKIPILIPTSAEEKFSYHLEIESACVKDTLRVFYIAAVRFDKKFGEGIRIDEAKEVLTWNVEYTNDAGEEIKLSRFKPVESEFDKCIYETCTRQFQIWLKRQPYSEMVGVERFYGYNAFTLMYHVYLVPKKR